MLFKRNSKNSLPRYGDVHETWIYVIYTHQRATDEQVDFTLRTNNKEGDDCSIGRKGDAAWYSQIGIYIHYFEKSKTVK